MFDFYSIEEETNQLFVGQDDYEPLPKPTHVLRERCAMHVTIKVAMWNDDSEGLYVDWVSEEGEIFTLRETSPGVYQMISQLYWLEWELVAI